MQINIQERVDHARALFAEGYNCCQAVALAYGDFTGLDTKTLATLSAPFGGGFGRLREVCGAVSGMTMIAGFLKPAHDISDPKVKKENYTLVQELALNFKAQNGSIVCRELLGLSPTKELPATTQSPKKRPCAELVTTAAQIVGEYINATQAEV